MKYTETIKKSLISGLVFWLTMFWVVYAVNTISSITNWINTVDWDIISENWYKEVSQKLIDLETGTVVWAWPEWNYCVLQAWWSCPSWFNSEESWIEVWTHSHQMCSGNWPWDSYDTNLSWNYNHCLKTWIYCCK